MNVRPGGVAAVVFVAVLFPQPLLGQNGAINFQNLNYMEHGDFVYCGAPSYGFTNQFTITAWIRWTTDPNGFATTPTNHENEGYYATYVAYGKHNSNDINSDSLHFSLRNAKTGNKFEFVLQTTAGTKTVTATVGPSIDTWYYLAATYDGANIRFYIDGVLNKTVAHTGTINASSSHRLNMGRLPWGYGFFVGYLDEVRIWAHALDSAEIMQQKGSGTTVESGTLKSYWKFDEVGGTTIDDSGPTNADGVFYTAAVDVHAYTTGSPTIVADHDKSWAVNTWSSCALRTVSGAGIDETNSIVSNTSDTLTLQNSFITNPVLDSKATSNDTWYGIEKSGETTQWVLIGAPYAVELTSCSAVANDRSVVVEWATATEVDNDGFSVERRLVRSGSADGSWVVAGFVEGSGTTSAPRQYRFVDPDLAAGRYAYRIVQIDHDGSRSISREMEVEVGQTPAELTLGPNYPNPFNPSTTILYRLPRPSRCTITMFDALGRAVAVLVNDERPAGTHQTRWDATGMPSGVYVCQLMAGEFVLSRKLVLMR